MEIEIILTWKLGISADLAAKELNLEEKLVREKYREFEIGMRQSYANELLYMEYRKNYGD